MQKAPGTAASRPRRPSSSADRGVATRRTSWRTLARRLLVTVSAALVLLVLTELADPLLDLRLAQVAYYAIAVGGLTVLLGLNGQISLGHGAFMMIGCYVAALLLRAENPLPLVLVLALSILVTAAIGVVAGAAAARLSGPYLAGATLALAVGLPALTSRFPGLLGGDNGLSVPPQAPPGFLGADFPLERWQAWVSLAAALITLLSLANLAGSRIGRTLRAVRDDEVAASLAGIDVARTRVVAFVISAACAGLAGGLLAFVDSLAAPGAFSLALSLALLTGVIVGGQFSLMGAVYGSILLVLLPVYAGSFSDRLHLPTDVTANLPLAVYGVVLIAVMLALPGGIDGGARRALAAFRLLRSRSRAQPAIDDRE